MVVNATKTAEVIETGIFDMYGNNSEPLKKMLKYYNDVSFKSIALLMASYDDAAFHLDTEARELLDQIGFKNAQDLGFRDNFAFIGNSKNSYSDIIKFDQNNFKNNKYAEWPDRVQVSGCFKI